MRSAVVCIAFLLVSPLSAQDLIVAEHGSAGVNPYIKLSEVNRYTIDLHFLGTLASYPLLSESPTAALMVGDTLFIGESNCLPSTNICAPHITEHARAGTSRDIGSELLRAPVAIRYSSRNEIVAITPAEIVRIDFATRSVRARFPLAPVDGTLISDGDVDPTGCVAAIANPPAGLIVARICGERLAVERTIDLPFYFWGVAFMNGGDILVNNRGTLMRFARDGELLRTYSTGATDPLGHVEVSPDDSRAAITSGASMLSVDLRTGTVSLPTYLHVGTYANSIAHVEPVRLSTRRRAVTHAASPLW